MREHCEEIDPREEETPSVVCTLDTDADEFLRSDPVSDLVDLFRSRGPQKDPVTLRIFHPLHLLNDPKSILRKFGGSRKWRHSVSLRSGLFPWPAFRKDGKCIVRKWRSARVLQFGKELNAAELSEDPASWRLRKKREKNRPLHRVGCVADLLNFMCRLRLRQFTEFLQRPQRLLKPGKIRVQDRLQRGTMKLRLRGDPRPDIRQSLAVSQTFRERKRQDILDQPVTQRLERLRQKRVVLHEPDEILDHPKRFAGTVCRGVNDPQIDPGGILQHIFPFGFHDGQLSFRIRTAHRM